MVYRAFTITTKIAIDMSLRYRCVPACGLLRDLPSYLCRLTKNRKKVGCIDKNTKNNKMKFKWFGNKSCLNIKRKKKKEIRLLRWKYQLLLQYLHTKKSSLVAGWTHVSTRVRKEEGLTQLHHCPVFMLTLANIWMHFLAMTCKKKKNEDDLQTYYQAYKCENVVMTQENWLS